MALAYFVDEKGPYAVPDTGADAELRAGAQPATPEQIAEFQAADTRAKTFGTTGQAILAGGEAAARALTLGLSTGLERAAGISPESIQAREDVNPVASGIGTVAGIAAPLVLSGGTSLGAQGLKGAVSGAAELSAPSIIARAGRGVVGALEGTGALGLPEASGLAGQIARKAVAEGLGSFVEGTAYGLGEVVHEAALGNPDLTAQSALGTVGVSALLGGVAGGVLGGASAAGRGVLDHIAPSGAKGVDDKVAAWLKDFEGERGLKAAGGIQGDIQKLERTHGPEGARTIGREMGDLGLVSRFSTPAKTAERAAALKAEVGPEITQVLKNADVLATPATMADFGAIVDRVRKSTLADLKKNPGLASAAVQFDEYLTRYEQAQASVFATKAQRAYALGMPKAQVAAFRNKIELESLHEIRRQIDDVIPWGKEPMEKAYARALRDFRSAVSREIEDTVQRVGGASDVWKVANRKYTVASVASDLARKGMQRATGNNPIPLTSILGALGGGAALGSLPGGLAVGAASYALRQFGSGVANTAARDARKMLSSSPQIGASAQSMLSAASPATRALPFAAVPQIAASMAPDTEKTEALASLERTGATVSRKLDTLASTLVRAGVKAANVGRAEIEAGIASEFAQKSPPNFAKQAEQIRTLASDPAAMMQSLDELTDDLHEHAPDTAQAIGLAHVRGIHFLESKLPKPPPRTPLGPKWEPSASQIAKFNRYFVAVDEPLSIVKQAAAGTLTPEGVEAVRTVYPDLYADMQTRIVEALTKHPNVPAPQRMMLSMLLGMDVDGSIGQLAANQATYQAPSQKPGLGTPRGDPGAGALDMAKRSETPAQRAASR